MAGELTPERLAELRRRHDDCGCSPIARADFLDLLDTIDAQAAAMRRYRLGWVESDVQRGYWVNSAGGWVPEPMTDAEQLVVYGRLVSGQEKDTSEVVRPGTDNEAKAAVPGQPSVNLTNQALADAGIRQDCTPDHWHTDQEETS